MKLTTQAGHKRTEKFVYGSRKNLNGGNTDRLFKQYNNASYSEQLFGGDSKVKLT
jgi:hypothetical protein